MPRKGAEGRYRVPGPRPVPKATGDPAAYISTNPERRTNDLSTLEPMNVRNLHERIIPAPHSQVGALLDDLGSPSDRLWPRDRWPPMRAKDGLAVGARAGHGPVRYTVEAYEPGRLVRFRFTRPKGFDGIHTFSVEEVPEGTRIRHELVMRARGWALLSWPLFFRPLHDAVLEDAFDRGGAAVGCEPVGARWSLWVRVLRRAFRPRKRNSGGDSAAGRPPGVQDTTGSGPEPPSPPTLTTPRLTLEPLTPTHLPALHAHWNEPEVGRFLWDGNPVSQDQVDEVIRVSEGRFREGGPGLWGVRLREPAHAEDPGGDGNEHPLDARSPLIGCVGFWHFHDPPELEFLVSLSPAWWGRGLAREACGALIRYAFDKLHWDYVQASADAPNAASLALMERLGMEAAGERPGEFGKILVFRIFREGR
jgi:RimJ/RimL family protein N-acetyltransferase